MPRRINENGNVMALALFIVVGLVIGFAAGRIMDKSDTTKNSTSSHMSTPDSGTKAANLRSTLVSLGTQHMSLTAQAVDATLDGNANAAAYGASLYKNGTDIGAAVGSIYGKDAEATFNTVWKLHLDEFVKYAVASSKGDTDGQKAALASIDTNYTKPLAAYLAKANPNLPEDSLKAALADHVGMTATMIDYHTTGKYTEEADELEMANKHIESLFSTLAGGIVKQYPEKF